MSSFAKLATISLGAAATGIFVYKKNASASAHPHMYERQTPQHSAFKDENVKLKNHFKAAVTQIPHYKKRDRGGEDAYILSEELVAVADGVGGWNRKGVDPGIFARELCSHVWDAFALQRAEGKKTFDVDLKKLLIDSVLKTKAVGTSTYVMAMMQQDDNIIKTLNLGDSGFMIVRPHPIANPNLNEAQNLENMASGHSFNDFELLYRSKE